MALARVRFRVDTTPDTDSTSDLTAAITSTSSPTSISVQQGTDFEVNQNVKIGSEEMTVTNIASNTLTVARGVNGTTATTHNNNLNLFKDDSPTYTPTQNPNIGTDVSQTYDGIVAKKSIGGKTFTFAKALNEDLIEQGLCPEALKQIDVIYVGTHHNATSQLAKLVVPTLTVFEKDGSFVNQNFRLQRFKQAVPGPKSVTSEIVFLPKLIAQLQGDVHAVSPDMRQLWQHIAQETDVIEEAVSWHTLPDEGLALNADPFSALDFVESKNLKYDPEALQAAKAVASID